MLDDRLPIIDITFDFRSDTPQGRDPDSHSPTLRRYHRLLWSKPLPSGGAFDLDINTPPFLHHLSELGEFWLTSDSAIPSFALWRSLAHIIDQIPPEETQEFRRLGYTIGGMMVFPGKKVGRGMTINGARGFDPRVRDRFDLTLECIRRHYVGDASPLADTLARYADFFALFGNFAGYVDFFLLSDLVEKDASVVRFFTPFDDFTSSPVPATLNAYLSYRQRAVQFLTARNQRIAALFTQPPPAG
jgi:hypothetical protein